MVKRFLLSFGMALLFLLIFLKYIPIRQVLNEFRSLSPLDIILAFAFYTVSQIVRSMRWLPLLKGFNLYQVYLINSANIFLNNLLPARTGELSWFYYANRFGVSFRTSLWAFFVGRFFDLAAMLFITIFIYYLMHPTLWHLLFFIPLPFLLHKTYLLVPPIGKLRGIRDYAEKNVDLRLSLYLFSCSVMSVILKFLALMWLVGGAFGFLEFLSYTFGELSSILPVHSFMGYGTYELSFSVPAHLANADTKTWILKAFLFHNFLLISSALYGVISLYILHRR
ncbi:MAG: lysylphosphatidylglycerol synthase domain-containing protein [Aquificaceae bacterium]